MKTKCIVEAYKSPVIPRQKCFAVDIPISNNSGALKKFAIESIDISAIKWAAHLAGNKHEFTCYFSRVL
jgi:hypothetical protein